MDTAADNDLRGKAVIVHAKSDDFTTQPSGAAGDRIACGVIRE
jgi:superoxide dismutase, Cu-Zn family